MTELETAALSAGAWVARTALAAWLGDERARGAADLAGLLAPHVVGTIERRRLVREFESAADSVATRLLDLDLDLARDEVAFAVDVLRTADGLPDVVVRDAGRGPGRLFRFLRWEVPAGRLADENVLRVCCVALGAILDVLPAHPDADALAFVLRSSGALSRKVEERLAHLPVFEEPRSAESFTRDYCASIADRFDTVEAFPAGPARLTPLFVGPDLLVKTGRDAGARLRFDRVLGTCRRLLVRGEGGAGKSTLWQVLAVKAATEDLFGEPGVRPVPFPLRLRAFADRPLPEPDEFVEFGAPDLAAAAPAGWADRILREGAAVVLVDGLDELPAPRRRYAAAWLADLVGRFPRIRCVVTGRLTASVPIDDTFTVADLAPMTETDVRDFVRRWYSAASEEEAGARLLSAVTNSRHLSRLATSPLMCALLCTLNATRPGPLPRDYMVYEAVLDRLLTGRRERPLPGVSLGHRETVSVLEQLAFWFVLGDHDEADSAAVLGQLRRTLRSMPHVTGAPDEVLRYLIEGSGVLRETVPGRVDFTHRVLREYLAARAVAGSENTGLLTELAHLDGWREVAALARELRPADDHAAPARDTPRTTPSGRDRRLVIAVDIERYSAPERTISHQLDVRGGMYEALREAMRESGVAWEECHREDTVDGIFVVFPPDADERRVVARLLPSLADILALHNETRSASARLRLLVAIHSGELAPAASLAFRLLHSQALRGSQRDLDAAVAVIASDPFYREFVSGPIRADFSPCHVHGKDTDAEAWLWVAGARRVFPAPVRRSPSGLLGGRVDDVRAAVADRQASVPLDVLKERASRATPALDLLAALRAPGIGVIAGLEGARGRFEHSALARSYAAAGVRAISAPPGLLDEVRAEVDIPLVYDDLVVSPYQVFEARAFGADAVVLTVAALVQYSLSALLDRTESLGMAAIVQAHTAAEVDRALEAGARVIGITAKDPETGVLDRDTFARLAPIVPVKVVKVAVSGIGGPGDILSFGDAGADAVLADRAPDAAGDPVAVVTSLVEAGASRWS